MFNLFEICHQSFENLTNHIHYKNVVVLVLSKQILTSSYYQLMYIASPKSGSNRFVRL